MKSILRPNLSVFLMLAVASPALSQIAGPVFNAPFLSCDCQTNRAGDLEVKTISIGLDSSVPILVDGEKIALEIEKLGNFSTVKFLPWISKLKISQLISSCPKIGHAKHVVIEDSAVFSSNDDFTFPSAKIAKIKISSKSFDLSLIHI